ncbi:MAG TPA: V-type ATPase 116kDa subunit family protein, partial [Gemmatimonadales bacterium]|nr:V-type ATPase 116kDa subunit family protein [Gemmatimonadales bacterium]
MILPMTRVRILGPRPRLDEVLGVLQDLGSLHLAPPTAAGPVTPVELDPHRVRTMGHLREALADTEVALAGMGLPPAPAGRTVPIPSTADLARWARLAAHTRRDVDRLAARGTALADERALILKYQPFFSAFRSLLERKDRWSNANAYHVLLKRGEATSLTSLEQALRAVIGEEFQLYSQPLASGETAVLVLVSAVAAAKVERLLADARVQEIPVPASFGGGTLTEAIPKMLARLGDLPAEEGEVARLRSELARTAGPELQRAQVGLQDRLQALEAVARTALTTRAFVVEGWVPTRSKQLLVRGVQARCGDQVVVSEVAQEEWEGAEAPVELANPRLLRPFETLIRLFPLPRYGSIDPTPFVAVFFPAFFGLMVGDIGYGLVLAALGLVLHWRS